MLVRISSQKSDASVYVLSPLTTLLKRPLCKVIFWSQNQSTEIADQ